MQSGDKKCWWVLGRRYHSKGKSASRSVDDLDENVDQKKSADKNDEDKKGGGPPAQAQSSAPSPVVRKSFPETWIWTDLESQYVANLNMNSTCSTL